MKASKGGGGGGVILHSYKKIHITPRQKLTIIQTLIYEHNKDLEGRRFEGGWGE